LEKDQITKYPSKHMRTLIVLVLGLLAVGCLTPEQKQKALRDSVVGEYEKKFADGDTRKLVLLDNGIYEYYFFGKKTGEAKWSIVNKEIHVDYGIFKINYMS